MMGDATVRSSSAWKKGGEEERLWLGSAWLHPLTGCCSLCGLELELSVQKIL